MGKLVNLLFQLGIRNLRSTGRHGDGNRILIGLGAFVKQIAQIHISDICDVHVMAPAFPHQRIASGGHSQAAIKIANFTFLIET